MKLFRASCPCGYQTRKARSGYHFHQWWFPVFEIETGSLSDIVVAFPNEDKARLQHQKLEIYHQTPRDDKPARRKATAKMRALADEVHERFIKNQTLKLVEKYASDDTTIFDPRIADSFDCPQCQHNTLKLNQVSVVAFCKLGCENEYRWQDSNEAGCPKCGHRPHHFQTEHEDEFASLDRTKCSCRCSANLDCVSHADGFCPKCGALPTSYDVEGEEFCGLHHEPMTAYLCPGNFMFVQTDSRWAAHQFPNAKLWGDAVADGINGWFCASCESDHQQWLEANSDRQ